MNEWKHGDLRCHVCDNGVAGDWVSCPYCAALINDFDPSPRFVHDEPAGISPDYEILANFIADVDALSLSIEFGEDDSHGECPDIGGARKALDRLRARFQGCVPSDDGRG